MNETWYYIEGGEQIGPVKESEVLALVQQGKLENSSYLWKRGFRSWKKLADIEELAKGQNQIQNEKQAQGQQSQNQAAKVAAPPPPTKDTKAAEPAKTSGGDEQANSHHGHGHGPIDWNGIDQNQYIFHIKVGVDRQGPEVEYGPFSIGQLRQAFQEKRINEKTFIFTVGMENWIFLADLPLYEMIAGQAPPPISKSEKRQGLRRPFVAQIFFHNNKQAFEGICRDISVGGLQVLVSDFPGQEGDHVKMNVHPTNSDHSFVATGKIVRLLEGRKGISLRFTKLDSQAEQSIVSYLDQY